MSWKYAEDESMWSRGELSDGLIFSTSHRHQNSEPRHIIRPLSRKDIFYSGSIVNLPEFQSQKSVNSYRQSILNIPRESSVVFDFGDGRPSSAMKKPSACPCFGPGVIKSVFAQILDMSLLKNPVFHFIAVSNIFGMLGFYPPYVFMADSATEKVGTLFPLNKCS